MGWVVMLVGVLMLAAGIAFGAELGVMGFPLVPKLPLGNAPSAKLPLRTPPEAQHRRSSVQRSRSASSRAMARRSGPRLVTWDRPSRHSIRSTRAMGSPLHASGSRLASEN